MKRETPRTNKTVPELTSDPARGGAFKLLGKPQESAPCQRAKERASRDRGFGYSNPREAGWSTS